MPEEVNEPNLILPILCPHCSKEIELAMDFRLLPPKDSTIKEAEIISENK
ncbi:MAG: hypothetical protein WC917_02945 [Bacilli bacterium]|jgi:hypothetical protein